MPPPPFAPSLRLTPRSRRPLRLPEETVRAVLSSEVVRCGAESGASPRATIVVVTFNQLVCTRLCLESLLATAAGASYEVVVVDNASTDGTPAYLASLAQRSPRVRLVLNARNRGFAAANNQGIALARGEVLVLLNNDTVVSSGWLAGLLAHLDDPSVGLVGPVTNRIGNEAEIEAEYDTYGELLELAERRAAEYRGESFDIPTLCMYCVAMRRDVHARIGPLDERFEVGMLEDDDYSHRARLAGYRVVCAEDVFIHHFGGASFGELVPSGEYGRILRANKERFLQKWGVPWEPYSRRRNEGYERLSSRIAAIVATAVPPGASVLAVSRGDEALTRLQGRRGAHFPQAEDGAYAGHHPATSEAAIEHLEALRRRGADHLLFPSTAFWWLEHYADFRLHLDARYRRTWSDESCVIYALGGVSAGRASLRAEART